MKTSAFSASTLVTACALSLVLASSLVPSLANAAPRKNQQGEAQSQSNPQRGQTDDELLKEIEALLNECWPYPSKVTPQDRLQTCNKLIAKFSPYPGSIRELNATGLYKAHGGRARAYLDLGSEAEAIADATKAIEFDKSIQFNWATRAKAYLESRKFTEAIADASILVKLENSVFNRMLRGRAYAGADRHEAAITEFTDCLRADPQLAEALEYRAESYRETQNYGGALGDYTELSRLQPQEAKWDEKKAWTELNMLRKPADALFTLNNALEIHPDNIELLELRIEVFSGTGHEKTHDLKKALLDAEKIIAVKTDKEKAEQAKDGKVEDGKVRVRLSSNNVSSSDYMLLGKIQAGLGDAEAAMASFDKALTVHDKDYLANFYDERCEANLKLKRYQEALDDAEKSLQHIKDDFFRNGYESNAVEALIGLGRSEEALTRLATKVMAKRSIAPGLMIEKIFKTFPLNTQEDASQLASRVPALEKITPDPWSAANEWKCSVANVIRDVNPAAALPLFKGVMKTYAACGIWGGYNASMRSGDYASAIEIMDVLLSKDAKSMEALVGRANAKAGLGKAEEADKDYEAAIARADGDAWPYIGRSAFYSDQGKHDEALKDAEKALKLEPKSARAHNAVARAYYFAKNFDKALPPAQAAVKIDRSFGRWQNTLAHVQQAMGKGDEASQSYRAVVDGDRYLAVTYQQGLAARRGYSGPIGGLANDDFADVLDACAKDTACEPQDRPLR